MWYRCGAVALVGWILGCGDAPSQSLAPSEPGAQDPSVTPAEVPAAAEPVANGTALQFSIDGWVEALGAKAQLKVVEGVSTVRLEITGGGREDVVLLDADFDGLAGSMGAHDLAVGLPGEGSDSAVASLGGQSYHSQAGQIEVSLSTDGSITGSFDLALAQDPDVAAGLPIMFELSDQLRSLSGQFSGKWELYCQSHLPGHMSELMKGGDYCDALAF